MGKKQKNEALTNLKKAILCLEYHAEQQGVDQTIDLLTKLWSLVEKMDAEHWFPKAELQEVKDMLAAALTRLHNGEYQKSPEEKAKILEQYPDMEKCVEKDLENVLA